jgi:WD40 repeat protein
VEAWWKFWTVAFSPDGKQVLTGSWDNTAVLRDVATGKTLQTWKHIGVVKSVAFSPDGKQVLTGSWDNTRSYGMRQRAKPYRRGSMTGSYSVAFSPDGKQVLTGSWDNTAVLRDVATGRTLQTWKHDGIVFSVAFSPDGKQVLTGSSDKTAVLRDAATGKTLQTWMHDAGV